MLKLSKKMFLVMWVHSKQTYQCVGFNWSCVARCHKISACVGQLVLSGSLLLGKVLNGVLCDV